MIQPRDQLVELRQHCAPAWAGTRLIVITLKATGWSDKRIALALHTTERSVRRNLDQARERLFDGTEIEPSREALVAWFWCHTQCCTAGALHSLETGRLLSGA
jgi:hypothetical protein